MTTVIVPVDFSETSLNAASYAVRMLTGVYGVNMILYHMYEKSEQGESSATEMSQLKEKLFDEGIVKIEIVCEQGHSLKHNLEKLVKKTSPDMIIVGITGRTKIGQALIGSNTLELVEMKLCPVLIIPPEARFNQLKHIVLASDFSNPPPENVVSTLKDLLSSYYAKLEIVNVNPEHHVSISEPYLQVQNKMDESFKGFQHEFYFIAMYDFQDTVNMFVEDHQIDMIATLPKDHNRLGALFGEQNTKKLAYQSRIPVLAMH